MVGPNEEIKVEVEQTISLIMQRICNLDDILFNLDERF